MTTNGNGKGGRHRVEINWTEFEGYCAMQCTLREIADYFNCSEDTIERRVIEHYHCGFAEIFKRKRQKGLMSLRASLFNLSKKQGNVAIFLAKNWLGMVDKQEVDVTNKDAAVEDLTDDELAWIVKGGSRRGTVKATVSPQSVN